jgi:hypothetical protein
VAKIIETDSDHPFAGGRKASSITNKHHPMVWENMLGTVMARNPHTGEAKYFDYNHKAAREFDILEHILSYLFFIFCE